MGNILALLRDLGKIPIARDLFIKLDSIGAKILMLDNLLILTIFGLRKLLLGRTAYSLKEIYFYFYFCQNVHALRISVNPKVLLLQFVLFTLS